MTKKSDRQQDKIRQVLKRQDEDVESIYEKLKRPKTPAEISAEEIADSYRQQGFDEGMSVSRMSLDDADRRMHDFKQKWGVYIEHSSNHRDNDKPFIAETDAQLVIMLRKILNANGVATGVRSITICRGEAE